MAQNITLLGASYSDVPAVELPKTGGGTASFTDVTDTTATASDVAQGKYFYLADGTKTEGTSTGGGGGSVTQDQDGFIVLPPDGEGGGGGSYTFITSKDVTVNTTSTSSTVVDTITVSMDCWTSAKILYVKVRDKAGYRTGYNYGTDTYFVNKSAIRGIGGGFTSSMYVSYYVNSSGNVEMTTSAYGVKGYEIQTSNGSVSIDISARYGSSYGTIDGTFQCDIYLLDWPDGTSPFVPPIGE